MKKSSYLSLIQIFETKRIKINIDGKVFRVLSTEQFNLIFLYLVILAITNVLLLYISKFKYYKATVIGNTIYSSVAAYILKNNSISVAFCNDVNVRRYYTTDYGEIPIDNPTKALFNFKNKKIKLIKLSDDDIKNLESHTKLNHLNEIQDRLVTKFCVSKILNESEGWSLKSLLDDINLIKHSHGKITKIIPFFDSLYCISTADSFWITKIIIDDNTDMLKENDVVLTNVLGDNNEILTLEKFYVDKDLKICSKNTEDYNYISPLYGLKHPRPFFFKNRYKINSLHFPYFKDVFLTIMVIILGLVG